MSSHAAQRRTSSVLRPHAQPLALLYLIVVLRTVAALSFVTFVPVFLTNRGLGVGEAGVVVAIYLLASSAGGFFGGPLADRFGPRRVIGGSLLIAAPFLVRRAAVHGRAVHRRAGDGRVLPAVDAAGVRRVRSDDRARSAPAPCRR